MTREEIQQTIEEVLIHFRLINFTGQYRDIIRQFEKAHQMIQMEQQPTENPVKHAIRIYIDMPNSDLKAPILTQIQQVSDWFESN